MSRLTAGKKAKKKQSEFQKLWAKAEKLKTENERFRDRLDAITQRVRTEIHPAEKTALISQVPLLRRLLTLGQRKSLAKWQRQELDDWIKELLEPLQVYGSVDAELLEDISRYDAFRYGIELDEASSTSLHDQLREHIEHEWGSGLEGDEASEAHRRTEIEEEVEEILNDTFGREPPRGVKKPSNTGDMFEDELNDELERQYQAYHEARSAAREELLEKMLGNNSPYSDEEDDEDEYNFFEFDLDDSFEQDQNDAAPVISNAVFKRMFRMTAGQLHPDRELDPELRTKKQAWMSALLKARKKGDVMTILAMFQEHVPEAATLSKADEKQLIAALQQQIEQLRSEQEEYTFESPIHRIAFEQFYDVSPRKTKQSFQRHLQQLQKMASESEALAREITSIKALKPFLEQRYDERRFSNPFEILDEIF